VLEVFGLRVLQEARKQGFVFYELSSACLGARGERQRRAWERLGWCVGGCPRGLRRIFALCPQLSAPTRMGARFPSLSAPTSVGPTVVVDLAAISCTIDL